MNALRKLILGAGSILAAAPAIPRPKAESAEEAFQRDAMKIRGDYLRAFELLAEGVETRPSVPNGRL